jgi:hypothetical protein
MHKKILLALLIVGVFALGVVSVRAWDHYQVSQRVHAAVVQAQHDAEVRAQQRAEADRAAKEASEKTRLHDVCVKNAVKAKTAVSACDIQEVQ